MIVGAALIELHVHGSHSLKQKRGVVQSIKQRVRNEFNVAVAEVGGQETWQRAVLGLTTVGDELGIVRGRLEKAMGFIERLHLAEVIDTDIEILTLEHDDEPGGLAEAWDQNDPEPD